MVYKRGSEVVDYVEKVTVEKSFRDPREIIFPKDSIVLRLYGELINQAQHIQRYQKKNKCGPHEFGFRHRKENKYIYIDLARSSNEAGYLPVRDNGNLYIDLDSIDFDNPNNKAFNLKALIDFKGGEELSINPKSMKSQISSIVTSIYPIFESHEPRKNANSVLPPCRHSHDYNQCSLQMNKLCEKYYNLP